MNKNLLRLSLTIPTILLTVTACSSAPTDPGAASVETQVPVRVARADLASGAGSLEELVSAGQLAVVATAGASSQSSNATDPTIVSTTQEFTVKRQVWGAQSPTAVKVKFTGGIVEKGEGAPYELQLEGQPQFEAGHDYLLVLIGPGDDGTYMALGGPQGRYEVKQNVIQAVKGTTDDPVISVLNGKTLTNAIQSLATLRKTER